MKSRSGSTLNTLRTFYNPENPLIASNILNSGKYVEIYYHELCLFRPSLAK